jgi:hypothetical protein
MASFKAFSQWFGVNRQASLNAAIMAAGGLGALSASTPLSWAVPLLGWRLVFGVLAAAGVAAAVAIWSSPDKSTDQAQEPLGTQVTALIGILKSRPFWRYAPQSALLIGGFMAFQGLWAVPWLMNFGGLDRALAAQHLLFMSMGQLTGFLGIAVSIGTLSRRGLTPQRLLPIGMGLGLGATLLIVLGIGPSQLLWGILGLVFSTANLGYALLQRDYPDALAGRVNTALNLMVFIGAFSIQWGFGTLVDGLQTAGMASRAAFQSGFAVLLALQFAAWLWYMWAGKSTPTTDL